MGKLMGNYLPINTLRIQIFDGYKAVSFILGAEKILRIVRKYGVEEERHYFFG
jgi:hypothetical protein